MTYDIDRDDDRINGYAAERMLATAVRESKKIHAYNFQSEVLVNAIEGDLAGRKHFQLSQFALAKEFPETFIDERGRSGLFFPKLSDLPTVAIIDNVLGLDCCVEYFGYRIGIDVTVNPNSTVKKQRKKLELTNVYKILQFDKIVILVIDNSFESKVLEAKLKIVKNSSDPDMHCVVYV